MIRVMHLGLGEIGRSVMPALAARPKHAQLVSVVDVNPALVGKRLRQVLGRQDVPNLVVRGSVAEALKKDKRPNVAIMTTGSRMEQVKDTIRELADAGVHVVSSCEELAFPDLRSARLAGQLDRYARSKEVAVLGTGVNPGYAMDSFALACTAPCTLVRGIKVIRSLDASKRRYQLQKKIAAGMTVAEFRAALRAKKIGHVGLAESAAMIARGLGWKLDRLEERFEPVLADHLFFNEHFRVEPGQVRGMWMVAKGYRGRKAVIELDLTMAFDVDSFDEVIIDGDPPLLVRTKSGFPGDASTVGMLVNCASCAGSLKPGLRTMLDVLQVRSVGAGA